MAAIQLFKVKDVILEVKNEGLCNCLNGRLFSFLEKLIEVFIGKNTSSNDQMLGNKKES